MAFITIPGFTGMMYVPDDDPSAAKKHPCADCFACQFCSDGRCGLCLNRKSRGTCADPAKTPYSKRNE